MSNPPGPPVAEVIPVDITRPRDRVSVVDDPVLRVAQQELLDILHRDEARELEATA
jgi:hypothetical protein